MTIDSGSTTDAPAESPQWLAEQLRIVVRGDLPWEQRREYVDGHQTPRDIGKLIKARVESGVSTARIVATLGSAMDELIAVEPRRVHPEFANPDYQFLIVADALACADLPHEGLAFAEKYFDAGLRPKESHLGWFVNYVSEASRRISKDDPSGLKTQAVNRALGKFIAYAFSDIDYVATMPGDRGVCEIAYTASTTVLQHTGSWRDRKLPLQTMLDTGREVVQRRRGTGERDGAFQDIQIYKRLLDAVPNR